MGDDFDEMEKCSKHMEYMAAYWEKRKMANPYRSPPPPKGRDKPVFDKTSYGRKRRPR